MILLLLPNIMFLRSIQADFYTSSSLLLVYRVSHCTTLGIYHSPPTDGQSQQGQFFVVTNSASVNVLGHISRCTCVSFSRVYSGKWNLWVGGCAHLQLYQLPNFSKVNVSTILLKNFFIPIHCLYIFQLPTFFLSLSHKLSSSPYPYANSYKSPRSSGLAGPEWDLCVVGGDGGNSQTSTC